jgi:hypothetical protein
LINVIDELRMEWRDPNEQESEDRDLKRDDTGRPENVRVSGSRHLIGTPWPVLSSSMTNKD